MTDRPVWRKPYDVAERAITPRADALVLSSEFAALASAVTGLRRLAGHQFNAVAAKVWHLANLPAGTDVQRLRQQVGALDREVRRLAVQLEQRRDEEIRVLRVEAQR